MTFNTKKVEVPISGTYVGWTLSNNTDRSALERTWGSLGLGSFVPSPNSEKNALATALKRVWSGPRCLVRPLVGEVGYAVVQEKGEDGSLDHNVSFIAKPPSADSWSMGSANVRFYNPITKLRITPARRDEMQATFMSELDKLPSNRVARSLVGVLDHFHAIPFKPGRGNGGIYYLPEEHYATWSKAMEAVVNADSTGVNTHYEAAVAMNAKTAQTVLRSFTETILKETMDMGEEIAGNGSNGNLGKRALKTKQERACHLRQRVKRYEKLLNLNLSKLTEHIEEVDSAAAIATLSLLANAGGE